MCVSVCMLVSILETDVLLTVVKMLIGRNHSHHTTARIPESLLCLHYNGREHLVQIPVH